MNIGAFLSTVSFLTLCLPLAANFPTPVSLLLSPHSLMTTKCSISCDLVTFDYFGVICDSRSPVLQAFAFTMVSSRLTLADRNLTLKFTPTQQIFSAQSNPSTRVAFTGPRPKLVSRTFVPGRSLLCLDKIHLLLSFMLFSAQSCRDCLSTQTGTSRTTCCKISLRSTKCQL